MDTTDRLALPLLAAGQAQKHVTLNEALLAIDRLTHLSVKTAAAVSPPVNPMDGEQHIIGMAPTGAFAGHARQIARMDGGTWVFQSAPTGCIAHVAAEKRVLIFDGDAWNDVPARRAEFLGINATATPVNRFVVTAPDSLFNAEAADHRVMINKAQSTGTATVLFLSGYSGRAEAGLAGSDAWSLKVSANGTTWTEALTVRHQDGNVGIGTSNPTHRLTMQGGLARFGWNLINTDQSNGASSMELMALGQGDRHAYFSFHASDAYSDYHARLIRFAGQNGPLCMINRGTSGLGLINENTGPTYVEANGQRIATFTADTKLGVGVASPTASIHAAGAVRTGSSTVSGLPSASATGAGAMIFVSNAAGGAVMAYSDGAAWRRINDGTVVS